MKLIQMFPHVAASYQFRAISNSVKTSVSLNTWHQITPEVGTGTGYITNQIKEDEAELWP